MSLDKYFWGGLLVVVIMIVAIVVITRPASAPEKGIIQRWEPSDEQDEQETEAREEQEETSTYTQESTVITFKPNESDTTCNGKNTIIDKDSIAIYNLQIDTAQFSNDSFNVHRGQKPHITRGRKIEKMNAHFLLSNGAMYQIMNADNMDVDLRMRIVNVNNEHVVNFYEHDDRVHVMTTKGTHIMAPMGMHKIKTIHQGTRMCFGTNWYAVEDGSNVFVYNNQHSYLTKIRGHSIIAYNDTLFVTNNGKMHEYTCDGNNTTIVGTCEFFDCIDKRGNRYIGCDDVYEFCNHLIFTRDHSTFIRARE